MAPQNLVVHETFGDLNSIALGAVAACGMEWKSVKKPVEGGKKDVESGPSESENVKEEQAPQEEEKGVISEKELKDEEKPEVGEQEEVTSDGKEEKPNVC
jgi:hypothetical protein